MAKAGEPNYKVYTLRLILFFTVFRILAALLLELGNDESYYWLYAQKLQWNYFDHPPLVALWTKLFTLDLWIGNELALRLGSIAGCAIASWFMFKGVTGIHSKRAGFFAVLLYNISLYASITAGLYLMPDAPQMVFWTLCLWMLARISNEEKDWNNWIIFGLAAGLCIMSKIHGVFIWGGLGLFTLFKKRNWLRLPQLYVAATLTLVLISPILLWNIEYEFATYRFHSQRVSIEGRPFNQFSFPREALHQLVWNNPVNVVLIISGIAALFRQRIKNNTALTVYLFIGVPFALLLLFVSIFRDTVLIHWSGPAYVSLIPLAAIYLASLNFSAFPKILKWAIGVFCLAVSLWIGIVEFYPGNMGRQQGEQLGQGDITLDMYGWKAAGKQFQELYEKEIRSGIMPKGAPLVCTYWWGAHVEYYFCRPVGTTMIGLGTMSQLHHYQWTNDWRTKQANADVAYCVMPSDDNYAIPAQFYNQVELATIISIERSGKPAHNFKVYRLKGLRKQIPVTY